MKIKKKLSKSFLEKKRPVTSDETLKNILPFKFPNEKEIQGGNFKNKTIIKLSK